MTTARLRPSFFDSKEREFLTHGDLTASTYLTDTGVSVVRITSPRVELEILPFQGQQIWSAVIDGRDITMQSEVDEPVLTTDYLRNYGAFLVHCGATAMGGPSKEDNHPLHGELPNAPYKKAWIEVGEDADGQPFLEVHGEYKHQVAMTVNYVAHPVVRISANESVVHVAMDVKNMSRAPMDFMYLAHLNFAPIRNSKILATHHWTPESVEIRTSVPSHFPNADQKRALMEDLAQHPERTQDVDDAPEYDPETVMRLTYEKDADGYAYSLQVHPDGSSDYVRHQPDTAPHTIRCIQLTDHHQCLGLALPSTAGVEGYLAEKEKGRVIEIAPGGSYEVGFDFGGLDVEQTADISQRIDAVMGL